MDMQNTGDAKYTGCKGKHSVIKSLYLEFLLSRVQFQTMCKKKNIFNLPSKNGLHREGYVIHVQIQG